MDQIDKMVFAINVSLSPLQCDSVKVQGRTGSKQMDVYTKLIDTFVTTSWPEERTLMLARAKHVDMLHNKVMRSCSVTLLRDTAPHLKECTYQFSSKALPSGFTVLLI